MPQNEPANPQWVIIHYISMAAGSKGFPMAQKFRVTSMWDTVRLRAVADALRRYAKHKDIAIKVELGLNFIPSGSIGMALSDNDKKNLFAGIHIDGIHIEGDFHADVDDVVRVEWWNQVQALITHLGFVFRPYAEVRVDPISPITFFRVSQVAYETNMININHLKFEKPDDE